MTVISLEAERIARNPHRSGPARCLNCHHEWHAIAPTGTSILQCPKCETYQGVYSGIAQTERAQWQCQCAEWTFFIDEHGPYCCHCGTRPEWLTAPRPSSPPKGAA